MSGFDRFCAVLAGGLGAILMLMGLFGLFAGIKAHFSLPPVLGLLPAFVGWGVIRSIMLAWNVSQDSLPDASPLSPSSSTPDSPADFGSWGNNPSDGSSAQSSTD